MQHRIEHTVYGIGIHDCVVTHMALTGEEKQTLTFHFPQGILCSADHPKNPYGFLVKTDAANMIFEELLPDSEDIEVIILKKRKWRKGLRKETWQEITLQDLMALVNSGKAVLELISSLTEDRFMRLECCLRYPAKERHFRWVDCHISLMSQRVFYEWMDPKDPKPYS